MTHADLARAKAPDVRASMATMRRAAAMARQTAIDTDTGSVIVREGKPVLISAEELRVEQEGVASCPYCNTKTTADMNLQYKLMSLRRMR